MYPTVKPRIIPAEKISAMFPCAKKKRNQRITHDPELNYNFPKFSSKFK